MRRHDEEITDLSEILKVFKKCDVIRLGLCAENKPYIVPLHFGLENSGDNIAIYLHCASVGKKLDLARQNDNVCFEADTLFETVEMEEACQWYAVFDSIYGEGKISFIEDATEKEKALDSIMEHYNFPGKPTYSDESIATVCCLKIDVSFISGKRKLGSAVGI